jgi:hypothetical protein
MWEIYKVLRGETPTGADVHRPVTYSEITPVEMKVAESTAPYGDSDET